MKKSSLNNDFLRLLNEKGGKKASLANEIAELLNIDTASVYRRLRGDVKLTVDEIGVLASHYNISLDGLLDRMSPNDPGTHAMYYPVSATDGAYDLDALEERIPFLEKFVRQPNAEIGAVTGLLNSHFFGVHEELTKYFLFRWGHYYSDEEQYTRYETVTVPDRLINFFLRRQEIFSDIRRVFQIWDTAIMSNLVKDIKYYESMGLMNRQHIARIKKELFLMLENFENFAAKGRMNGSDSKFEVYSSSLNLDASHVFLRSDQYCESSLSVFIIKNLVSTDRKSCEIMINWAKSMRAGGVLISESAEKERRLFFHNLRSDVDKL